MFKTYIKIICGILLILITLTGCSKKTNSYGFSLPINDMKFGMTSNEVARVLNMLDYKLIHADEISHTNYLILKQQELLNESCNITFSFFDYDTGELKDKLYCVTVEYYDINIDKMITALEKSYGDSYFYEQVDTKLYTWQKSTLSSLTDDMIEKMKVIESSGYVNLTDEQISYIDLAYKLAKDIPLSSIRFLVKKSSAENEPYATLVFEGKYSILADLANAQ
jgi:hypothetical protein